MRRPRFKRLTINCAAEVEQKSYRIDSSGNTFQHGDLTIGNDGVKRDDGEEKSQFKIQFEDLQIKEKLGAGTSGVVHRALYKGENIAVKVIDIFEREKRHQILKEIRSMSKTISPFVASFMGAFFHEGSIFIALEYLDAGSLEGILTVSTFPVPAIRIVARQLVAGLQAIHALKQMHRDIKPSNICLTSRGEAKLMDFGISKEVKGTLGIAKTFVGTCTYMSPERIQGEEYLLNSDIWSLGLTLLQSVVGRYPYKMTGVYLELMQQIVQNPAPTFPETEIDTKGPKLTIELRAQFRDFIALSLQKDPKKRQSSQRLMAHKFLDISNEQVEQEKKKLSFWLAKVKERKKAKKEAAAEKYAQAKSKDPKTLATPPTVPKSSRR